MGAKSRIVRAITLRAGYATTMNNYFRLIPKLLLCALTVMIIVSCSPPEKRPTGWAKVYEDGKELFGRSDFERAVDYVRELALIEPSNDYSERGQVLSVILLSGLAQGYWEVAEAYGAGIDKLEDPAQRSEYRRLRLDAYQYARTHALHLAEVARQFVESHEVEEVGERKELMVECPYPAVDPPSTNQLLQRAIGGIGLRPKNKRKPNAMRSACTCKGPWLPRWELNRPKSVPHSRREQLEFPMRRSICTFPGNWWRVPGYLALRGLMSPGIL